MFWILANRHAVPVAVRNGRLGFVKGKIEIYHAMDTTSLVNEGKHETVCHTVKRLCKVSEDWKSNMQHKASLVPKDNQLRGIRT